MANQEDIFKKVISHAKEYGYVVQSSEIYDGLSAVYDYLQNGAELKKNIREYWWQAMVQLNENIVGIDSAICAAMAVDAIGEERVRCVMMPYDYTTKESLEDAKKHLVILNNLYTKALIEVTILLIELKQK